MGINYLFGIIAVLIIVAIKKFFKKTIKSKAIGEKINGQLKAQPKTKNKWLHPSNEFGELQKGVVYDSKTYKTSVSQDEVQQEINIINK